MKHIATVIMVCLCYVLLLSMASGQVTWAKINDAYYAFDPRDMSIARDGSIYAIGGPSRELVKSTNQGTTWTRLGQNNVYCVGVKPTNSQIVLIGIDSTAYGGTVKVRRSSDGGGTWTDVIRTIQEGMSVRANRIAFHPARPESVLVACVEGTWTPTTFQLFRSINGGVTFQGLSSASAKQQCTITDLVIDGSTAAGIGYITGATLTAGSTDRGVWRSTGPFTVTGAWSARNSGLVNKNIGAIAVDPSLNTRLFCASSENSGADVFTTYVTTNSGTTWLPTTNSSSPSNNKARSIVIASSNIYIATILGIWASPTGINPIYTKPASAGLLDSYCQSIDTYTSGSTTYLFCGTAGAFYRSVDGAVSWLERDSLMATVNPVGLAKSGSTLYVMNSPTGAPGSLLHRSLDGGTSWTLVLSNVDSTTGNYLEGGDIAIKPDDPASAILSGRITGNAGIRVLRTTNTGAKWLASYPPSGTGTANQVSYDATNANRVYVAAQNSTPAGVILRSTNAGASFTPSTVGPSNEIKTVIVHPTTGSTLYCGGTTTGVYKSIDYGATWTPASTGLPANSTINSLANNPNVAGTLYAATGAGTYYSLNSASSWSVVTHQSSSSNIKSIILHPKNSSCSYQILGSVVYKNALTGLDGPWGTALTDETDGLGLTFRKVVIDPTDLFHIVAATSGGLYIKAHGWDGYLESNTTWPLGADILVGSGTEIFGMNNVLRLDAVGSVPANLTVNAGAVVKFFFDGAMYTQGACAINALGSAGSIISFTPANPTDTWGGINIQSGTSSGVFQYCDFYRNASGVSISSSASSTIRNCTFRDCGAAYSFSQVTAASVLAKKNRVTGPNIHGQGVYISGSTFAMDSCYISDQLYGLRISGGAPGFRADTIENNGNVAWGTRLGGVYAYSNASPKFGGWSGSEAGNNIIRNNDSTQVLVDNSTVLLGDSLVGTGQVAGNNSITDISGRRRVSALHNAVVKAQYCFWNSSCPPPSSFFYVDATSSINTRNCTGIGIPVLIAPINNQSVPKTGTIFSWHKVTWPGIGKVLYHLQEDIDSTFANPYLLERDYDNWGDTTFNASSGFQVSGPHYWRVVAQNPAQGVYGSWSPVATFTVAAAKAVVEDRWRPSRPASFGLSQNHPNPFNPETKITYDLPEDAHVKIVVYDVLGKEVGVLVDADQPAGTLTVSFDGSRLPSGVYFYRIQAGKFIDMKKMVLAK